MKRIALMLCAFFCFSYTAKCQVIDSISGRIESIRSLNELLLITLVSSDNVTDTCVVISAPESKLATKPKAKMKIGGTYTFAVEKNIVTTKLKGRFSVQYNNTVVWTNKEPYKLKPRLCLNCMGEYIK